MKYVIYYGRGYGWDQKIYSLEEAKQVIDSNWALEAAEPGSFYSIGEIEGFPDEDLNKVQTYFSDLDEYVSRKRKLDDVRGYQFQPVNDERK